MTVVETERDGGGDRACRWWRKRMTVVEKEDDGGGDYVTLGTNMRYSMMVVDTECDGGSDRA
jgi:hypothetical protein